MTLSLFLGSCANIVSPTGGEKDIIPPKILKTIPGNYTTNFKGDGFRLYFDEFSQVKDESKNLIISPAFKIRPELKLKGKSLIVSFKDTLHKNTTYNFNFGNAIQDITEANPLSNYQFIFSTGNALDSMEIQGKVSDALTLSPVKDAFVMLYDRFEDSIPYKESPLYLAKTAEDGTYHLHFLGHGPYKIIALLDKNSNYMFDGAEENIAFSTDSIIPEGITAILKSSNGMDSIATIKEGVNIDLLCFKDEPDSVQRVSRPSLIKPYQLLVTFRFPVKNPDIHPLNDSSRLTNDWALQEWNKKSDSLILWLNPTGNPDSLNLFVSDRKLLNDTIKLNLQNLSKSNRLKKSSSVEEKAAITSNASTQFGLKQDFMVNIAYPVKTYNFSKAILMQGKDTIPNNLYFPDSIKRQLHLKHDFKENTDYTLYVPANSFTNIIGQKNDTLRFSWRTRSLKEYGDLKVELTLKEKGHYIVQLLNIKDIVVKELFVEGNGMINFDLLEPGKYRLKLIWDKNNNGQWDTGHYLKKNQPEKISFFSQTIEVRGNWQLEETWEL